MARSGRLTRRRALALALAPTPGCLGLRCWPRLPSHEVGAALGAVSLRAAAAPDARPWALRGAATSEPMRQLQGGGPTGLLGLAASGTLWGLSLTGQAPRRIAGGLDAATPVATGHGRIAARTAGGALWVWGAGEARASPSADLADHAGLLILPAGVIGVVEARATGAGPPGHRLARFEADGAQGWREVARSHDAVLPDARPLLADLDGRGDGGHVAVLAGPDSARYGHAVLGDGIEATRVLWLERHRLEPLRSFDLPAPHVFEDIALRVVLLPGTPAKAGLLTVRAGPEGGQLALLCADPLRPAGLHVAALGDGVGGLHRWLAPTTDGRQLAAVHTPHIGGVLHVYRHDGSRLTRTRLAADVSTHRIGSREVDLAVWLAGRLILPSQDGLRLRVFDLAAEGAEVAVVPLPGRVIATAALAGARVVAVLLEDGRVVLVGAVEPVLSRG